MALLGVTERMCRPSGVDAGAQCVDAAHGTDSAIGAEVVLRQSAVAADDSAARVLSKQFDGSVFVGNCDAGGDGASASSLLTNNNEATIRADDQTTSSHRIPNLNRNIIMNIERGVIFVCGCCCCCCCCHIVSYWCWTC